MKEHTADPGKRQPHHLLAQEVLALIHGEEIAKSTAEQHRSMRKPSLESLSAGTSQLQETKVEGDSSKAATFAGNAEIPATLHLPRDAVYGRKISYIMVQAGFVDSRAEAQRMISAGGVYVGTQPSSSNSTELKFVQLKKYAPDTGDQHLINDKTLVFRLGKWKVRVIEIRDV